jgi:Tol biopolymer transport system component
MKKIFPLILILIINFSCKDEKEETTVEPGSNIQQITNHPEGVGGAVISEDGNTIFYVVRNAQSTYGNNINELYSINSDGSNQKKILTLTNAFGAGPILSRNNRQIAFTVKRNANSGQETEIMMANFDGTNLRTVKTYPGDIYIYGFVENDQSLIYHKEVRLPQCYCNTIWKLKIDNSSDKMISGNEETVVGAVSAKQNVILADNRPGTFAMDPDGQNIVQIGNDFVPKAISEFNSDFLMTKIMPAGNMAATVQIFISNAAGTTIRQLTNSEATNLPKSFTPDGQEILFQSYKSASEAGDSELYFIKPDGTDLQQLTNNNYDEWPIGFLEKKRKILFSSKKDGSYNLYVLQLK